MVPDRWSPALRTAAGLTIDLIFRLLPSLHPGSPSIPDPPLSSNDPLPFLPVRRCSRGVKALL